MSTWDEIHKMIETRLIQLEQNIKYANLHDEALYLSLDIRDKLEGK